MAGFVCASLAGLSSAAVPVIVNNADFEAGKINLLTPAKDGFWRVENVFAPPPGVFGLNAGLGAGGWSAVDFSAIQGSDGPLVQGVKYIRPHSGNIAASFSALGTPAAMTQTLATKAGGIYEVRFFAANPNPLSLNNKLVVSWNGTDVALDSSPNLSSAGVLKPGTGFNEFHVSGLRSVGTSSILGFGAFNNEEATLLDDVSVNLTGIVLNPGDNLFFDNPNSFGDVDLIINGGTVSNPTPNPVIVNLVNGNITQNAGTLIMQVFTSNVPPSGVLLPSDRFVTNGRADFNSGTLQISNPNGLPLRPGDNALLISAGGGVSVNGVPGSANGNNAEGGAFIFTGPGGVSLQALFGGNPLVVPRVTAFTNQLVLETAQGSFVGVNGVTVNGSTATFTPIQLAVAQGLDGAALGKPLRTGTPGFELLNFLDTQPGSALGQSLQSIAPTDLTAVHRLGNNLSTLHTGNIFHHLEQHRMDSNQAQDVQGGGTTLFPKFRASVNVSGSEGLEGPSGAHGKEIAPPMEHRFCAFAVGSGSFASVDGNGGAQGFHLDTGIATIGIDYRVTEQLTIGLDVGYANTRAHLANGGGIDVDGGMVGVYASYADRGFHVDATLTGGVSDYRVSRAGLGGFASGDPSGSSFSAAVDTGYDWKRGRFTFGPRVGVQYIRTRLDGYTETGSLAPMVINANEEESIRASLGLRMGYKCKVKRIPITAEASASYQREFGSNTYSVNSSFRDLPGPAFAVSGPAVGRDGVLVNLGVTALWNEAFSTYLGYDGEFFRSNYESHSLSLGGRYRF